MDKDKIQKDLFYRFKEELTDYHKDVLKYFSKEHHLDITEMARNEGKLRQEIDLLASEQEQFNKKLEIVLKDIVCSADIFEYVVRDLYAKNLFTIKSSLDLDIQELTKGHHPKLTTRLGDEFVEYITKKSGLKFS